MLARPTRSAVAVRGSESKVWIQAFLAAWEDACSYAGCRTSFVVPDGEFLLGPITFSGSCHQESSPEVVIKGLVKALLDLVAFSDDSWIKFTDLHGIGSLSKRAQEKSVISVHVRNCTLSGTMNGVRIKTWPESPGLKASDIIFEDIIMENVSRPIIIDQNYCPVYPCTKKAS
ncbi:exopolygalacturonase-like [Magnolia sinica]|uniref:exopolygalacturonase-like n=1 Tax=Magnolia sinica TaxID=86752 RepID=UPI002657CA3E|nr:exopolygalacturonase-like [Magnolia sinica]